MPPRLILNSTLFSAFRNGFDDAKGAEIFFQTIIKYRETFHGSHKTHKINCSESEYIVYLNYMLMRP